MLQTDSIATADSLAAIIRADSLAYVAKVDSLNAAVAGSFPAIAGKVKTTKNFFNEVLVPEGGLNAAQKNNSASIQYANDLFKTHHLKIVNDYPRTNFKPTPDWFSFVLILVILSITFLRTFYKKIFNQLMKAFYNSTVANQIIRDENILVQRASVTLSITCYFVLALLIYKIADFYNYNNPLAGEGIVRFLFIALAVSLIYSVKMIALKVIGFIFKADKYAAAYIFTIFMTNNVIGVVLIPILIVISYAYGDMVRYFYFIAMAITIAGLFYRWTKGIVITMSIPNLSLIYIIFYLCGLEIAPLLVLAKLVSL